MCDWAWDVHECQVFKVDGSLVAVAVHPAEVDMLILTLGVKRMDHVLAQHLRSSREASG